ncbi:hypothetical protein FACS1894166_05160 [Bacilli bacterium]|nr:hypothetical protein FACS1894166_05160 [Bacilli bacterium]
MKKSLAYNSAKKRKILLGTLIPLGCLVIATAIAVPVVLTQCSNSKKFKSFDKFYRYAESHIESPSEGMNFTNGDYLGNDGTDPRMLS